MWRCESTWGARKTSGFQANLDIPVGRLQLGRREQTSSGAGREPSRRQWPRHIELLDDRSQPAAEVPHLRSTPAQEREQGAGTSGSPEEVSQSVCPVGEFDRLDPWLVEQDGALEHIHRRSYE